MAGPILPEEMRGRPFLVADVRAAGLPFSRVRHSALHLPTRSVRCTDGVTTVVERAAAFAKALPADCAFSHVTAAVLHGIPLPHRRFDPQILDVMRTSDRTPIRRRGCTGHRGLELRSLEEVGGLRVVSPLDTWCDLGELVTAGLTVDDLVVAGDTVARRLEMAEVAEAAGAPAGAGPAAGSAVVLLQAALDSRVAPRGKLSLSEALLLVRSGSRSPMETRARLMFVRAGFPEPELNAPVRDVHGGWLLEADLYWRRQRVIGEYQGADHASRRRRSADSSRAALAEEHDHRLVEIYSEDVFLGARRRACLRRFARALEIDPAELVIA